MSPVISMDCLILEHMCLRGPKRPTAMDITRELDGIGAEYNAFTSQEDGLLRQNAVA